MPILHRTCSRVDALSFITVVPSYYHCITLSHRFNFVLSWTFIPSTIFTFLWLDSILLYQRKMGMEARLFLLFCIHIILIRKYFFKSAYFFPFNLKSLLKQKLSTLKGKFYFCNWQVNLAIFSNVIRLQFPPNR